MHSDREELVVARLSGNDDVPGIDLFVVARGVADCIDGSFGAALSSRVFGAAAGVGTHLRADVDRRAFLYLSCICEQLAFHSVASASLSFVPVQSARSYSSAVVGNNRAMPARSGLVA